MIRKLKPALLKSLWLAALATQLTGCFLSDLTTKDDGAAERSLIQAGPANCGANAFRQVVHPQLRNNCASCHAGSGPGAGSFGAFDLSTAYQQALSRSELGSPGASYLVTRSSQSGHGGGCSACGASWGQTLAALIAEWAKAEAGDAATCANYQAPADGGGANTAPFDLGPYQPPRSTDTRVVPEGLTAYSAAGGVHSLVRAQCAQCHVPGGLASFAPFAVADATSSYREAKPRVNFAAVDASILLARANTVNHGGSCMSCGNAAFVNELRTRVSSWISIEGVAVENARVKLASKSIAPLPGGTTDRVISWDLGAETVPAIPALAGATFSVRIRMATGSATTYRISDPRITTGSAAVQVKEIAFLLNDAVNTSVTTYSLVDTTVPSGQAGGVSLSGSPALLPAADSAADTLGFSFEILRSQ